MEFITLVAAVVAAATSIGGIVLTTRLSILRQRRVAVWSRELERMFKLEELAGMAKETVTVHRDPDRLMKYYVPLYVELNDSKGRLSRYGDLASAIDDLAQTCANLVDAVVAGREAEKTQAESRIATCYRTVLAECDKIVGRQTDRANRVERERAVARCAGTIDMLRFGLRNVPIYLT